MRYFHSKQRYLESNQEALLRDLQWDDVQSNRNTASDGLGGRHLSEVSGITVELAKADAEHYHVDDRVELSDTIKLKREMLESLNDYKQQKQALKNLNVKNEAEV